MTYKLVISAIIASSLSALPAIAKTSVTKGNGTVRIANEHVAMEFADNGSFDIVSMKFAGTEMAKPGDNRQPWSLTYLGEQGETPTIEPRYAVYHGWREEDCDTSKAIVFSWHTRLKYDGNNYPVEMRVSLDDNADLLRWNLSANVPDNWTITNFVFPNIAIDSPVEGKVITPGGWGNEYALKENGDYEANYPSWNASMQMIMLDSKKGTFYFSPEDRNACGKMMRIREKTVPSASAQRWQHHTDGPTRHLIDSMCLGPRLLEQPPADGARLPLNGTARSHSRRHGAAKR